MNGQNIPPPPQYPAQMNNDMNETNMSKEGSVMENSVVYISDNGSPNYKSSNRHDLYHHQMPNHQILPNLVNSINSTYQNLPPKSPKSSYRNAINACDNSNPKLNYANEIKTNSTNNTEFSADNDSGVLFKQFSSVPKGIQPNQWFKPREDWESSKMVHLPHTSSSTTGGPSSAKTRSHPNLMNDYVNLSGAEPFLTEILNQSHRNRAAAATAAAQFQTHSIFESGSKQSYSKPQHIGYHAAPPPPSMQQHQQHHESQFSPNIGAVGLSSSPEILRNGGSGFSVVPSQLSQGLSEHLTRVGDYNENFSSESSRLVNLLLEENKRLRSKLRQSDTRLEVIDQLERKIHNMEVLFDELLTSQRRQRLLDLQLQQASLSNYLSSRNIVMSHQDVSCSPAAVRAAPPPSSLLTAPATVAATCTTASTASSNPSTIADTVVAAASSQLKSPTNLSSQQPSLSTKHGIATTIEDSMCENSIVSFYKSPRLDATKGVRGGAEGQAEVDANVTTGVGPVWSPVQEEQYQPQSPVFSSSSGGGGGGGHTASVAADMDQLGGLRSLASSAAVGGASGYSSPPLYHRVRAGGSGHNASTTTTTPSSPLTQHYPVPHYPQQQQHHLHHPLIDNMVSAPPGGPFMHHHHLLSQQQQQHHQQPQPHSLYEQHQFKHNI